MTYLLFERSIRTSNGRDHMQIQMIPFSFSSSSSVTDPIGILNQKMSEYKLSFIELEVSESVVMCLFSLLTALCFGFLSLFLSFFLFVGFSLSLVFRKIWN
jgi:hypothetical protein